jgi:hypothetical protein
LSKLADKIKQAARSEPQAIGFGSAKAAAVSTMVLAGAAPDVQGAAELAQRGADVVIAGSAKSPVAAASGSAANGAIAGARISGTVLNEATQYREAGFDLSSLTQMAAATALLDEDRLRPDAAVRLPDNDVRTLESFQLDAIDVGAIASPLTVRKQIDLRRIFAMTRKPLMATIDGAISAPELQALRERIVGGRGRGAVVERLRKPSMRCRPGRARTTTAHTAGAAHNGRRREEEHDHDALGGSAKRELVWSTISRPPLFTGGISVLRCRRR